MPDISMCSCHDCVKKTKCLRYMAKPSSVQSYGDFSPKVNKLHKFECDYFWGMTNKHQRSD